MYIRRGECEYHYLQPTCFDVMSDAECACPCCAALRCVCTSPAADACTQLQAEHTISSPSETI